MYKLFRIDHRDHTAIEKAMGKVLEVHGFERIDSDSKAERVARVEIERTGDGTLAWSQPPDLLARVAGDLARVLRRSISGCSVDVDSDAAQAERQHFGPSGEVLRREEDADVDAEAASILAEWREAGRAHDSSEAEELLARALVGAESESGDTRSLLVARRRSATVQGLIEQIAAGATWQPVTEEGRRAVRVVTPDGARELVFLSEEEQRELEAATRAPK